MGFSIIIKRHKDPTKTFFLEEKQATMEKDEIGNRKTEWVSLGEIQGILQWYEPEQKSERGLEEIGLQINGFFVVSFEIPERESPNFRILELSNDITPIATYYRILHIDRHLYRGGKRSHYEFMLEENPKW